MKNNNKQSKIPTCTYCKKMGEIIGVAQAETHYYSLNINTNQLEDFHGDGDVESQKFFVCIARKKLIIGCKKFVEVK